MNSFWLSVLLTFCTISVFSQSKSQLQFSAVALDKVIVKIEKEFEVKYSYVDTIIIGKKVTLEKKFYTLDEINLEIEKQTQLKTSKISERYYSIFSENTIQNTIQLEEILVESFLVKGIQKANQKYILSPKNSEILPGITDADVFLSLQQLPGVRSPNETATGLHVRGGTADQNLVLYDGIRLFHPGHLFGMISGINPNTIKKVTFYEKATNPKYGERIASTIVIETSTDFSEKTKVEAGINSLNADINVQIPLIKNKLDVQLSGRKSFTESVQSYTFNQLANKVFQNTDFKTFNNENKFQFHDYSAKIIYQPTAKSLFTFTGLSIDNSLNYSTRDEDFSVSNQEMKIYNTGYSFNWIKNYSESFSHRILVYYSVYDFNYVKRKQAQMTENFEAFKKLNRIVNSGAEINFSAILSEKVVLDFGYQVSGNDVSHLFNSFNQNVGFDLNLGRLYDVVHTGFTNFSHKYRGWNSQLGLRYNYYSKLDFYTFEPRIFLQNKISTAFIVQLSYERKNQQLSQVRENIANDLSLENYIWVLGDNAKYDIQTANQFTAGLIYKKNNWTLDFDTYFKTFDGISNVNLGFLNQNESNSGNGFTKGADLFVQKITNSWRTSFTYSYQDTQNRFENLNNNAYFQSNASNTHLLNAIVYKSWNKFTASIGWVWHTGKPFSDIDENGVILALNQDNLPNYHRMDFSIDYTFSIKNSKFKTGISMYNLYNRKSLLSREYERKYASFSDFTNERYERQDFYSLGFTPNVFFRISF
jgi:hypothetical protein